MAYDTFCLQYSGRVGAHLAGHMSKVLLEKHYFGYVCDLSAVALKDEVAQTNITHK